MLNRPKKVLIGKNVAWTANDGVAMHISGGTGLNKETAEGEVLILNKYYLNSTNGSSTYGLDGFDQVIIAQCLGDTYAYQGETGVAVTGAKKFRYSDPIDGALLKNVTVKKYSAKAEQISDFTVTNIGVTAGTEYVLRLIHRDLQEQKGGGQFVHSYRYTCITGETVDSFTTAMAAVVNAHAGRRVQATRDATSLIVTGIAIPSGTTSLNDIDGFSMVEFDAFLTYIDSDGIHQEAVATLATTAASYGSGNWEQVRDLEREALGNKGITSNTVFPVIRPDLTVVKSTNYDSIVFEHAQAYRSSDNQYLKTTPLRTYVFFVTGNANQAASFCTRMSQWLITLPRPFNTISLA
jgi:hypothetical protein